MPWERATMATRPPRPGRQVWWRPWLFFLIGLGLGFLLGMSVLECLLPLVEPPPPLFWSARAHDAS